MLKKYPRLRRAYKKTKRAIRYAFVYYVIIGLKRIFLILPEKVSYKFCETLAALMFYAVRTERARTLQHLKLAFGNTKSDQELYRIAKNVFINQGRTIAELLRWEAWDKDTLSERVTLDGKEHIDAALAKGRGAIILTGHLANWELLAAYIAIHIRSGSVIARKFHDERLNNLLNQAREAKGNSVIDRDDSPRKILAVLKRNELIGILADQDIKKIQGTFVTFFGRPAYTPTAPVVLAAASKADLLPTFAYRNPDNPYKLHIKVAPPIELIKGRKDPEALRENTQRWTTLMEEHIRAHPDQWVWMHRRWRTTPEMLKGEHNG